MGSEWSTSSLSNYSYNTSIATNALGYSFDGSNFTVSAAPSGLSMICLNGKHLNNLTFVLICVFFKADWLFQLTGIRKQQKI
jgi:hypothetical protein